MTKHALVISPDYPPANRMSSLRAYFIARALTDAGYHVTVLAESSPAMDDGLPRPDYGVAVTRIAARHRAIWLLKAIMRVLQMAMQHERYDVIVSSSGPALAHAVAALARHIWSSAFWLADYRDLWSTGSYYHEQPFSGLGLHVRRWVERLMLVPADLVTTVSRGLQENLSAFHGRDVLVFHNGFESAVNTDATPACGDLGIRICHTGFLYQARTPLPVMDAIARTGRAVGVGGKRVRLLLAGTLDSVVTELMREFAGCPDIEYLGKLPREQAYALQRSSDFCLLLEDPEATRKGVVTGKVFEYIGMRKQIIAYGVAADSELAAILRGTGLLAFCGSDQNGLEAFLSQLSSGAAAPRVEPDESFIARFDRTVISGALVKEIDARASARRHPDAVRRR